MVMQSVVAVGKHNRWGGKVGAAGAIVGLAMALGASTSTVYAQAPRCSQGLVDASATSGWQVNVDESCSMTVHDREGRELARVTGHDADMRATSLRRVVVTPSWVFVLRTAPADVMAYRLPALTPVRVVGDLGLREPADMALVEASNGSLTAFVLDNAPDADRFGGAERAALGSRIVRLALTPHASGRRDVLVTGDIAAFGVRHVRLDEWRTLRSIAVEDGEVRVVVDEDGRTFREYYTLSGVVLERERIRSH